MKKMVNVFIPYPDVEKSIKALHIRTISKMLHEINVILKAIDGIKENKKVGYMNHPITLMWKDYKGVLECYQALLLHEYNTRTYPNLDIEEYKLRKADIEVLNTFLDYILKNDEEYFRLQRQHLRYKSEQYKTDWYIKEFPLDITKQGYKVLINNEWVYYPKK